MSEQGPAQQPRRMRPILPAVGQSASASSSSSSTTTGTSGTKALGHGPQRRPVTLACEPCRKRKSKCSAERPTCRLCVQRRTQCHYAALPGETMSKALGRKYEDLRGRATAHEEILTLLKTLPSQDAKAVLQKLRAGTDVATIVNHVEAGDLLLQMAVVPETRSRYEFPYRSGMLEEYALDNPYLDSLIYEAALRNSTNQDWRATVLADRLGSSEYGSPYLRPFHAAQVVEPRLFDAKPSLWTAVCDDDTLMRDLLQVFLRCEYQFTSAVHKDYFLEDMFALRSDFCSSLLVNVLLAYACVCNPLFENRAEYWNPHTLTYRFLAEAKRLWELEASVPRITTVQAGIVFSVIYNLCGLDEIGQPYRVHVVALAHALRLFDSTAKGQSGRIRNGRAFTAWTLFNWETLTAFSFMLPPLLTKPPDYHLPDPSENAEWYGEIWLKYPLSHSLSPAYFGHIFKAKSQFRIIMNEFCHAAYSKGSGVTFHEALQLRSRLEIWYNGLSRPLRPEFIVLPGHLQLHIYYYHLILTIFEPLYDKRNETQASQPIIAEAKKRFQTLVRLYYLRHGFEAMDLFIVIPLMVAGTEAIEAIDETRPASELETLRSTLILVAVGLHYQRRNHYLAEALFRVIRGRMRPQEVALLKSQINFGDEKAAEPREFTQAVRSHWPVSVVKRKEDTHSHLLTHLVENYARLNTEE